MDWGGKSPNWGGFGGDRVYRWETVRAEDKMLGPRVARRRRGERVGHGTAS